MAWRGPDPLVGRYGVGASIQPDRNTPAHRYPATKPHATGLQDDFAGALTAQGLHSHDTRKFWRGLYCSPESASAGFSPAIHGSPTQREGKRSKIIPDLLHALAVLDTGIPNENRIFAFLIHSRGIENNQATHSVKHYNDQIWRHSVLATSIQSFSYGTQQPLPHGRCLINAEELFASDIPSPELFDDAAVRGRKLDAQVALGDSDRSRVAAICVVRDVVVGANQLDQALTGLNCTHHPPNPAALSLQY